MITHEERRRLHTAPGLEGSSLVQAQHWSREQARGAGMLGYSTPLGSRLPPGIHNSTEPPTSSILLGRKRQVPLALKTRKATAPTHLPGRVVDPNKRATRKGLCKLIPLCPTRPTSARWPARPVCSPAPPPTPPGDGVGAGPEVVTTCKGLG